MAAQAVAEERWQLQYFYDEDKSSLEIVDLKFPSAERGVAVGAVTEGSGSRPVALVTSDGGASWSIEKLKENPRSLFFLNENLGWMVTEKGIWQTREAGRSWRKLKSFSWALRVHFLDERRGWAVGLRKSVFETNDGGATWTAVSAAAEPKSNGEHTQYTWIDFADGQLGLITGFSRPPRRDAPRLPEWVDPENARKRREWPSLTITLDTRDAGRTWKPASASMFGEITRVRFSPDGWGLGLIEFRGTFEWPCEVFRLDSRGGSRRVYREKGRTINDLAVTKTGTAYLAGVETIGTLRGHPIPGRLAILRSQDLESWIAMEIDYRANARRVMLAKAPGEALWVGTDTGMILKLAVTAP